MSTLIKLEWKSHPESSPSQVCFVTGLLPMRFVALSQLEGLTRMTRQDTIEELYRLSGKEKRAKRKFSIVVSGTTLHITLFRLTLPATSASAETSSSSAGVPVNEDFKR